LVEKGNDWEVIIPSSRMSLILAEGGKIIEAIGNYLKKNIHLYTLEEREKEESQVII
jgi:hypothetical protein